MILLQYNSTFLMLWTMDNLHQDFLSCIRITYKCICYVLLHVLGHPRLFPQIVNSLYESIWSYMTVFSFLPGQGSLWSNKGFLSKLRLYFWWHLWPLGHMGYNCRRRGLRYCDRGWREISSRLRVEWCRYWGS